MTVRPFGEWKIGFAKFIFILKDREHHFPDVNEHNAWYVRCHLKDGSTENKNGSGKGGGNKLAGKRIAIKDNICVAGIPMMDGSALMEGYIPDDDATVVQRILKEGKLNL